MKLNLFLLFILMFSVSAVSALDISDDTNTIGVNINPTVSTNYSTVSVNNSLLWAGNAWSASRWLDIDGGNANTDISIGSYDFSTTGNVTAGGFLTTDWSNVSILGTQVDFTGFASNSYAMLGAYSNIANSIIIGDATTTALNGTQKVVMLGLDSESEKGNFVTMLGSNQYNNGSIGSTIIGNGARIKDATLGFAIGYDSVINDGSNSVMAFASQVPTNTPNVIAFGNAGFGTMNYKDLYLGTGVTHWSANNDFAIHSSGRTGTNRDGADLSLVSGLGTGKGEISALRFRTTKSGVSGTTPHSTTERMMINDVGVYIYNPLNISGDAYADAWYTNSPDFRCSNEGDGTTFCKVGIHKYPNKELVIEFNTSTWNILNIQYQEQDYTKRQLLDRVCQTDEKTTDFCTRIFEKIESQQEKKTCKYEGYSWDGKCYENVQYSSTYKDSVEIVEHEEWIGVEGNCTELNVQLKPIIVACSVAPANPTLTYTYEFKDGCGWQENVGYYCMERLLR
tara:strand:- start:472 stop:1998 length:1527 start_codon:yes stop_codon:yes gene_type:complete